MFQPVTSVSVIITDIVLSQDNYHMQNTTGICYSVIIILLFDSK